MYKIRSVLALIASFFGVVAQAATFRPSDLVAPQKREGVVLLAEQLARVPRVTPTPTDLPDPFNPTDFDRPQRDGPGAPTATPVELPATDRETLEILASLVPSAGTMIFQGKSELTIGRQRIVVGRVITVSYKSRDYDLEIVDIGDTTIRLRYRNQEITRSTQRAVK